MIVFFGGIIFAYMVGSIPTSYIVGKATSGIDLRNRGSRNLGATNAFRVLGWKVGVVVLLCDILKGALPVLFLPGVIERLGGAIIPTSDIALAVGIAAIVGHTFTVFMKFKGGKGVATSLGVFLALAPLPLAITLAASLAIIWLTHYVSAGSIAGAVLLPVLIRLFYPNRISLLCVTVAVAILILVRHRSNIRRLLRGEENKLFT